MAILISNIAPTNLKNAYNSVSPLISKAKVASATAFVVCLLVFSSIPIAVFAGVAATTGVFSLAVAGTGVALVEGGILAFGSFILSFWLFGALFFAGLATFWFSAGYLGIHASKKLMA